MLPAVVQGYETDVIKEFAISGNDAIIKCSIPSYVADLVSVISWTITSVQDEEIVMNSNFRGRASSRVNIKDKIQKWDFSEHSCIAFER